MAATEGCDLGDQLFGFLLSDETGSVDGIHHNLKFWYGEAPIGDIVAFFMAAHFGHNLISVLVQHSNIFGECPAVAGYDYNGDNEE